MAADHAVNTADPHDSPVILVHGANHGGWQWDGIAAVLAEHGHEVHALDCLGHGRSRSLTPEVAVRRGITDIVADIEAIAVAVGGPLDAPAVVGPATHGTPPKDTRLPPTLIGHSIGGLAAMLYAARYEVHRLVLLAPTPPMQAHPEPNPIPVAFDAMFPVPPLAMAHAMFFTSMSAEDAKAMHARLVPASPRMVWEASRGSVWVDVDSVHAPVLCIAAEADGLFPVETQRRLAALLDAELIVVPGAGHSDVVLQPGTWPGVASAIVSWLGNTNSS